MESEVLMILFNIVLIIALAKVFEEILAKYGQVPVLGDFLAGIILGPSILGLISPTESIKIIATLGLVSLLFLAGSETDIKKMKRYGLMGAIVGLGGVVISFISGFTLGLIYHYTINESLFIGAILVATSVGVTIKTLMELHAYGTKEAYVIVGAAVFDDIYGLLVLAIIYAIAVGGKGLAGFFTVATAFIGLGILIMIYYFTEKHAAKIGFLIRELKTEEAFFVTTFIYGLFVAIGVGFMNLNPVVGAFFMGLAFSRMPGIDVFREKLSALTALMSPVYFALVGLTLSIKEITFSFITLSYILTFIIIGFVSKIIGCAFTAKMFHFSWREALIVGVGMVPRAEVASIIAFTGIALNIVSQETLFGTMLLIYASSIFTPVLLKYLYSVKTGE